MIYSLLKKKYITVRKLLLYLIYSRGLATIKYEIKQLQTLTVLCALSARTLLRSPHIISSLISIDVLSRSGTVHFTVGWRGARTRIIRTVQQHLI